MSPERGPDRSPSGLRTAARGLIATYLEDPITGLLSRLGLSPNALTLAGLVIAGAAAYLAASGLLIAAGLVLLASGAFDLLDGALARATGRVTRFGGLLDSVTDRVSEAVVLLGILIFYTETNQAAATGPVFITGTWAWTVEPVLVYLALSGSVMVSYIRARAEALGISCEEGLMTRPERVIALSAALVAAHWWTQALTLVLAIIAIITALTAVQRLITVRRRLQDESADGPSEQ